MKKTIAVILMSLYVLFGFLQVQHVYGVELNSENTDENNLSNAKELVEGVSSIDDLEDHNYFLTELQSIEDLELGDICVNNNSMYML